jgi:endonuclease-3
MPRSFAGRPPVAAVMKRLRRAIDGHEVPALEKIAQAPADPGPAESAGADSLRALHVVIGTLLSARTQDATTEAASARLFAAAPTAEEMAALPVDEIERLIYPVSFYRHKARHVKDAAAMLIAQFGGQVPGTMEELLRLPGVGRKTANLVLILAFGSRRNICVDTHVHRIANRLGWVQTRTPEETEQALYRVAAPRWWPEINLYLVTWGQNVCRPVYPRCGECAISRFCPSARLPAVRGTSVPAPPGTRPRSARRASASARSR